MSDQIPIWVTIGQCEEWKVTKKRNVQLVGGKGGQVSESPLLPAKETGDKATPYKFRITHEARQLLLLMRLLLQLLLLFRKQKQFQHIKQHIQQHYRQPGQQGSQDSLAARPAGQS